MPKGTFLARRDDQAVGSLNGRLVFRGFYRSALSRRLSQRRRVGGDVKPQRRQDCKDAFEGIGDARALGYLKHQPAWAGRDVLRAFVRYRRYGRDRWRWGRSGLPKLFAKVLRREVHDE